MNQNETQQSKPQDGSKSSQKNSQVRSNKMKESKESKLDISDEMPEQDDDYTYCAASHLMKENIRRTYPQYAFIAQLPLQLDKISQIK